jgi:O-6-methylguanine DNA methyltransferase
MAVCRTTIMTPIGPLEAAATERGLCALEFRRGARPSASPAASNGNKRGADAPEAGAHLDRARTWLIEYFAGRFEELQSPALDLQGTPFELAVWQGMQQIPIGSVSTYSALAMKLGRPRGARAVGLASGRNPVCLIVPCHRVVGANGSLVGYGGGLDLKRRLLEHEGAIPSLLAL